MTDSLRRGWIELAARYDVHEVVDGAGIEVVAVEFRFLKHLGSGAVRNVEHSDRGAPVGGNCSWPRKYLRKTIDGADCAQQPTSHRSARRVRNHRQQVSFQEHRRRCSRKRVPRNDMGVLGRKRIDDYQLLSRQGVEEVAIRFD